MIFIKVKLFAIYQETFGQEELELQVKSPITVSELLKNLLVNNQELQKWIRLTRFGVNCQFVESDFILNNGDEVVFIPPVSGG